MGAAYGMYTFPLAHLVGSPGAVHSSEPQSGQHRILTLVKCLLRAEHVNSTQAVLEAQKGNHTLIIPSRFGIPVYGHAHIEQRPGLGMLRKPQTHQRLDARMHTVDSWCESMQLDHVSFLKVDVEGFEPEVLVGAIDTIDSLCPSMLLEIEDRHVSRYGRTANEFADEIRTRWPDYTMHLWSGASWKPVAKVQSSVHNYLFATRASYERP
ncbi:FkbM family methyltransferase [Arthrobacter sp. TMN-50]